LTTGITLTPRVFTMLTDTTVTSRNVTTFMAVCFETRDLELVLAGFEDKGG